MTTNGNTAGALVEAIDELVKDENLETRAGLKMILKVFREITKMVGSMDGRLSETEQAYIRFTNTNNEARKVEEENQRELVVVKAELNRMSPTLTALKWIGGIVTFVITALLTALVTGQLVIVRP